MRKIRHCLKGYNFVLALYVRTVSFPKTWNSISRKVKDLKQSNYSWEKIYNDWLNIMTAVSWVNQTKFILVSLPFGYQLSFHLLSINSLCQNRQAMCVCQSRYFSWTLCDSSLQDLLSVIPFKLSVQKSSLNKWAMFFCEFTLL